MNVTIKFNQKNFVAGMENQEAKAIAIGNEYDIALLRASVNPEEIAFSGWKVFRTGLGYVCLYYGLSQGT